MDIDTIARVIENSGRLTGQDGDGWLQRHWRDHKTKKYYVVEYTSTEHEDAAYVWCGKHEKGQ